MNLVQRLLTRPAPPSESRDITTLDEYAEVMSFLHGGLEYGFQTTYGTDLEGRERIDHNFVGYVQQVYRSNGVVFACMALRMLVFSEARFQFRQFRRGRPGDLFGTEALEILERPWPNAGTGDLLSKMITDVDTGGNAYIRRTGGLADPRLERLRPDWVGIVMGSNRDLHTADLLGYVYWPEGPQGDADPVGMTVAEVAHWAPYQDPLASYKGMSWLTPILREVMGDQSATMHKLKFFENAATPNMAVRLDPALIPDVETFRDFKEAMDESHGGVWNAYKTLYLLGALDFQVIGSDFQQMDFRNVQGLSETRIAADAGTPPVLVGLSEGMQGSSLNAGNYAQAKRRFGDATMRPLWRSAASALSSIIDVPPGSELWYDDRDIPFLAEDRKDAAEIFQILAQVARSLTDGGWEPDDSIRAVSALDISLLLGKHTGKLSVQLQEPGEIADASDDERTALVSGNGQVI